jgi:hypothetical protein
MSAGLAAKLWSALGGPDDALQSLRFEGEPRGLPSRFHVGDLASATVGVAALAVAELAAKRRESSIANVTIDREHACAAFRCERFLAPVGWRLPPIWDPIAGDYEASDGWIRLHTNYAYHRDAVLRALGVLADKAKVAAAVRTWRADALESAVVDAGGVAAVLRTHDAWNVHPQGAAVRAEPLIAWGGEASERRSHAPNDTSPLDGIRVIDCTRVIAGPVGTRYLAAFGADVVRVDPPGFAEVFALLPETTRGKRCAALDLREGSDRASWDALVAGADVFVHGFRPGAMEALGYPEDRLREINPSLAIVRHDAYGWSGPWAKRRGFDSLVQMSCGIAYAGDGRAPSPLPAQALDHGTGYLIAAAACRALTDARADARLSLARTARLLVDLGEDDDAHAPSVTDASPWLEEAETAWGRVLTVRCPGEIEGSPVRWRERAGALGRHPAQWLEDDH